MRKAKTASQLKYAAKKDKLNDLRKAVDGAASKAAAEWLKKNLDSSDLAVKPLNIAYIKGKAGVTKVLHRIAEKIIYDRETTKKQIDILKDIQPEFPDIELQASIWHRPLSKGTFAKVGSLIDNSTLRGLKIKDCKNLSEIRKNVNAHIQSKEAIRNYTPKIAVSRDVVVVNDQSYPVIQRTPSDKKSLAIRVSVNGKRQWIRLDAFVALLAGQK